MDGPDNYRAATDILHGVGGINAATQADIPALLIALVHASLAQTAAIVAASEESISSDSDWGAWRNAVHHGSDRDNLNADGRRPADELDQHEVNVLHSLVSRFDDSV